MKPKYRALTRILPSVVSITLSLPFAAQAGIFTDDLAGNATPTTLSNGATTIRADGGAPLTPAPFVNIGALINMTGSLAPLETEVLEITSANYTVTNLGTLAGSAHDGINSTVAFTLLNSGTISAAGGNQGIQTLGAGTSITNNAGGIISGTNLAIFFTGNGGTVVNAGTIDGITGASSDGIFGNDTVTITNNDGGLIRGNQDGVDVLNGLKLTNNYNATITGVTSIGIFARSTARIDNYGTISGVTSGINVTSGAIINNLKTFLIGPDAGGQITASGGNGITATFDLTLTNEELGLIRGSINGIVATNGGAIEFNVTNSGAITGLNGDGIRAQDSFVVVNNATGVITGSNGSGLFLRDTADVTNRGSILGSEYGINLFTTTTASVVNHLGGTITGTNQVGIIGDVGVETVTNAGTITGGTTSLQLNGGANIVNLNDGSVLNGDLFASGGSLAITMDGGKTSTGDSTLNIINGNVNNAITLNKTGSGLAVVDGLTDANTISVTGGYLYLLGDVSNTSGGENIVNAIGAEIGGLGTWDSAITVTNGGSISPGASPLFLTNTVSDSIGTMTVTGDVTLDIASRYVWNSAPNGPSDLIDVDGVGNVFTTNNSNFVISPTNVNSPFLDGATIVVSSDEVLVGNFADISVAAFPSTTPDTGLFQANQNDPIIAAYFASLSKQNGSTDWQLTITHDYGQFGTTPNEVAAGDMLTDLVDTATGDVADLLAAMDFSDESVTQGVLAALDPGAYMATAAMLANNNYRLHRTVESHNAAVRAGTPGCECTSNFWGSFAYDTQDLNTSSNSFNQDGDVTSFTGGIDFTVTENFRLGLVAEGSQTDFDGDNNLGSEVDSYRFAAYANWGSATGWFVDALFGYNKHDVDQSRSIFMTDFATESASYDADGWQGLLNIGYAMDTSVGTISPFVGLEWQQLSVDSFSTSDGPLPLGVGGFDIDSFRALAGVRWEGELCETVKGYASAAYAFEFEDDAAVTDVAFGGGSYRATGLEQGDSVLLSAGIRWAMSDCTTLDLGYRGEFAMDDGIDSNGGNVGFNFSF